jgi:alpha/beta superfamily hydrolase
MPERRVQIAEGPQELEAAFEAGPGPDGAVLCHPHPLYGGNMDNNVVMALKRSLAAFGWATLRFNFRGVGSSGGSYGDGEGEVDDLLTAAAYLQAQGSKRIHMVGYSFGAWIILQAARRAMVPASLVLVSPPVDFLDFASLGLPPVPTLITLGNEDSFCSLSALKKWLQKTTEIPPQRVRLEILEGCDHFYWGHENALGAIVSDFINSIQAAAH